MIVNRINEYLSTEGKTIDVALLDEVGALARLAFERQFGDRPERSGTLRLSSIGRCLRQQAYRLLNFEPNGKEIDSRAKMVFFMGDLTELAVVALAKAAGCAIRDTGDQQATVSLEGIQGHPDGLLIDSGESYVLEVKSMSSFSFKEFERGVLDPGYEAQCNAYMEAKKLAKCVIVALNKDAGVLAERVLHKNADVVRTIYACIETLKKATPEDLPYRPFGPDEKGWLPWNCLYCPYWGTCWPKAQKILVSGKYKLALQNQPKGDPTPCLTPTPKSLKTASSSK